MKEGPVSGYGNDWKAALSSAMWGSESSQMLSCPQPHACRRRVIVCQGLLKEGPSHWMTRLKWFLLVSEVSNSGIQEVHCALYPEDRDRWGDVRKGKNSSAQTCNFTWCVSSYLPARTPESWDWLVVGGTVLFSTTSGRCCILKTGFLWVFLGWNEKTQEKKLKLERDGCNFSSSYRLTVQLTEFV